MILVEFARERRAQAFVGELFDLEDDEAPRGLTAHDVADFHGLARASGVVVDAHVTAVAGLLRLSAALVDARRAEPAIDSHARGVRRAGSRSCHGEAFAA